MRCPAFSQAFNRTRPWLLPVIPGRGRTSPSAHPSRDRRGEQNSHFHIWGIQMNKRLTLQAAKVTGADAKNPQRFRDRACPTSLPLGEPRPMLGDAEREAWQEFAASMPWLVRSDRHIVEVACRLSAMAQQPGCPIAVFAQLRLCLSSLGGTPTDVSRINWSDDSEDDDPTSEFLN